MGGGLGKWIVFASSFWRRADLYLRTGEVIALAGTG